MPQPPGSSSPPSRAGHFPRAAGVRTGGAICAPFPNPAGPARLRKCICICGGGEPQCPEAGPARGAQGWGATLLLLARGSTHGPHRGSGTGSGAQLCAPGRASAAAAVPPAPAEALPDTLPQLQQPSLAHDPESQRPSRGSDRVSLLPFLPGACGHPLLCSSKPAAQPGELRSHL